MFRSPTFPQVDSTGDKKLLLSPSIHSIQINATSIVFMNQIGGQIDFDVLRSINKNFCVGTRLSVERYFLEDFGGSTLGSPFTNYNLYSRLSTTIDNLSISVLGGVTYYTTDDPIYLPDKYLFRAGFKVQLGNIVGLVFKGSTSLIKNSSFIGIGVCLGYDHMQ